jgi:hypothetical protein
LFPEKEIARNKEEGVYVERNIYFSYPTRAITIIGPCMTQKDKNDAQRLYNVYPVY